MQHREPAKIPTSTMTRKEIEITIHQEEGKKKLKLVDPLEEQIFCSACSEILQEPYQVTCCGENLCMKCLGRIKSERDNCPNCSAVSYFGTRNNQLYEKIRRLRVHCLYEDRGCDWIGNIEELKLQHLNLEGDQEACQFVKIKCPYCHELVNFETINRHRVDICLQRPFACQYCLTYQSTFADIMSNHRYVCPYWALQCANDCGELIMQMDMNDHIRNDCPLTVLDCEFEAIGCTAELPREEMSYHMTNNVSPHMILMARALKDVTSKTEAMMESMKREMEQLKEENASLQKKMRRIDEQARPRKAPIVIFPGNGDEAPAKISLIGNTITVAELTMSSYSKNKRGNSLWYSPPFYNHQKGYRFCLRVYANGYSAQKGKYMSVFMDLMPGEFDDNLTWPFYGELTVELVNQHKEQVDENHSARIIFKDKSPDSAPGRVSGRDKSPKEKGIPDFIHLSELPSKFLKNDCLIFRILRDYHQNGI